MEENKIKILCFATNKPHVQNYIEIKNGFDSIGIETIFYSVTLDKWYLFEASDEFNKNNISVYDFPRPSGNTESYWRTKNIHKELYRAYSIIKKEFDNILKIYSPDLFITCSDDGYFEVGFIESCKQKKIPSLLIAEIPVIIKKQSNGDKNKTRYNYLKKLIKGIIFRKKNNGHY